MLFLLFPQKCRGNLVLHNFKTHFLSPANPVEISALLAYWGQIKISNRENALRHPKKMENAVNNNNNNSIVSQFPHLAIRSRYFEYFLFPFHLPISAYYR